MFFIIKSRLFTKTLLKFDSGFYTGPITLKITPGEELKVKGNEEMSIFNVTALLGGLALFLFGMDVMGKALERQAGGKLQTLLARLTDRPIKGLLMGLLVTAVIQSSSATTVMVVGFVNSGIIQLHQAVGIIMGSNIGTTVTAWILSLTGVQGDSLLIQLCKPANFSPILAAIGVVLYMGGNEKRKGIGTIMLGFTVLMTGMEAMSSAMEPLADEPWFADLFLKFSNPVLGVLAGAVLTGIIQSSSASVGILQALSATGSVTMGAALPIIMGQNIGTCVTALISSVGATKNARRAAMIHLYFNIIGVIIFLTATYTLNFIWPIEAMNEPIQAVGIATIHTLFNVSVTLILLPFSRGLEKLAILSVPDDKDKGKEKEEVQLLDPRLLNTPAVAVAQAHITTVDMANLARSALQKGMAVTHQWDEGLFASITREEDAVDQYEDLLGSYLVQLSTRAMNLQDSRKVNTLLHCISDFERVSDHAFSLAQTAKEMHESEVTFSAPAMEELKVLENAVQDLLDKTIRSFEEWDLEAAHKVEPLQQVVDSLIRQLKERHIARLQGGECDQANSYRFGNVLNNYQRVAGHCSNVAVDMIEVSAGSFDTHEYLDKLKAGSDPDFDRRYSRYADRYAIPEEQE